MRGEYLPEVEEDLRQIAGWKFDQGDTGFFSRDDYIAYSLNEGYKIGQRSKTEDGTVKIDVFFYQEPINIGS